MRAVETMRGLWRRARNVRAAFLCRLSANSPPSASTASSSSNATAISPPTQIGLGGRELACLALVAALSVGLGLGGASRLTYHEAFVTQGACEILATGHWSHPSIGGLPWLEKPPLPFWLVAALGWVVGAVSPAVARAPSALAALGLVWGVALLAARWHGRTVGLIAGAIQATTAWTVLRGRLAEADILLACLIAWCLLAFDHLRTSGNKDLLVQARRGWCWAFFGLLGVCSLVKGTGFGAVLILAAVTGVLIWDRDRAAMRRLASPWGWTLAGLLALAWPLAMVVEHGPKVVSLWAMHVTHRVGGDGGHGPFAGEGWGEYGLNVLGQAMPWTPLAIVGACLSLARLVRSRSRDEAAGDRLLWCWAVLPMILVSLPGARNAHYAIHMMAPWSIWAALGLVRLAIRLRHRRGWPLPRLRRATFAGFGGLALAYGLGFALLGPWLDRRGVEWEFYETAGRDLTANEPVVLLYDDWDRDPYPTPFGPIPHDLAVRLYYLNQPACWHFDSDLTTTDGSQRCPRGLDHRDNPSLSLIGRDRDIPALEARADVEILRRGQAARWDRDYLLARLRFNAPQAVQAVAELPVVK